LGIDFGTRYTKVALSLPHIDRREVLSFGSLQRLLPARVLIDDAARVAAFKAEPNARIERTIDYLKVRLANPSSVAFGTSMSIGTVNLPEAVEPLSAYFLARVFDLSVRTARRAFPQELDVARSVNWSANVGVPVKHCDGDALEIFQKVACVAWEWAWRPSLPQSPTVHDLIRRYERTAKAIVGRELAVNVSPELAAALVHFAEQRNTPEGLYVFVDVGGGTVDGSVCRLSRSIEGSRFEILSADVDEIGTMAIARELVADAMCQ
jgi:hypothetical protein